MKQNYSFFITLKLKNNNFLPTTQECWKLIIHFLVYFKSYYQFWVNICIKHGDFIHLSNSKSIKISNVIVNERFLLFLCKIFCLFNSTKLKEITITHVERLQSGPLKTKQMWLLVHMKNDFLLLRSNISKITYFHCLKFSVSENNSDVYCISGEFNCQ